MSLGPGSLRRQGPTWSSIQAGNSARCPAGQSGPANNAEALYLNVTPLLPVEITALFDSYERYPPKGLPRMLISPQYRAQNEQGFLFEALFGITDDGVVFQGTFDLLFDVGKLTGNPENKLGLRLRLQ